MNGQKLAEEIQALINEYREKHGDPLLSINDIQALPEFQDEVEKIKEKYE